MKTIICDFKRSSLGVIGEENEHNAIELLFNLPKDFEVADYIHVEFDTMDGDPFARDTFEFNKEEMTLRGRLDQKVMKAGELKIQLVGYAIDEEGTIDEIAKSPVIKAIISNSVNGIITEGDANPSMIELLKAKLDKLLEEGINIEGGGALPVAYINDQGELCFELGSGITDAYINQQGELELVIKTEEGEKPLVLGKVKGRTPEFRLTEKILEIKYDDETEWSALVDFSTIASSFDLRLNEETFFLEAQREVDGDWEPMVDLSALKLAHEHSNKSVLDKITSSVFEQVKDAISKRHKHENIDALNQITDEHIENIDKIPEIEEDVTELKNNPTKQLVEGILYTDETKRGLSANKNAIPTADNVWIEGNASNYYSFDEFINSATLNVVTNTSSKSTTTTVTIDIVCNDSDSASFIKNTLNSGGYYIGVVFEDTFDKTFYIKISSVTISDTTVSVKFTFIDGQETFPITGNITRNIQSLYAYPKNGVGSHIEGLKTIAASDYSHVQGKYNEIDTEGKYAHIVGNGTDDEHRSNAHTLDWEGNAWYAGSIKAHEVFAFDEEVGSYINLASYMNEIKDSIPEIPDIPTKTSELTNDSNFITENDRIIKNITVDSAEISLIANTLITYDGPGPMNIISIPQGTSWLKFIIKGSLGELFEFSFPHQIAWKNNIHPPVGNDQSDITICIKFEKSADNQTFAEWFLVNKGKNDTVIIDNRLLPLNINPNFARVEDGELIFLPLTDSTVRYNNTVSDYKRVYGEDPYELSQSLMARDECELMFQEFDDLIFIYWVVTPKGSRIKEYIDSSLITNWSYAFEEYKNEDITSSILFGNIDTSNGVLFMDMFYNCKFLKSIPEIDTSKGTNFSSMFWYCSSLETIPELDTSNGTDFSTMFINCSSLQEIPELDTSNGTDFHWMFRDCSSLQEIPELDTSNGIEFWGMFSDCTSLEYIPTLNLSNASFSGGTYDAKPFASMFYDCTSLITIEKLIFNSGKTSWMSDIFGNYISWQEKGSLPIENITIEGTIKVDSNNLDLSFCPNLTVNSLMSFINAFEDNTTEEVQYTVILGTINLSKLTPEQILIATNKNILLV